MDWMRKGLQRSFNAAPSDRPLSSQLLPKFKYVNKKYPKKLFFRKCKMKIGIKPTNSVFFRYRLVSFKIIFFTYFIFI